MIRSIISATSKRRERSTWNNARVRALRHQDARARIARDIAAAKLKSTTKTAQPTEPRASASVLPFPSVPTREIRG